MTDIAKGVGSIPSGLFIIASQDQKTKEIDGYLASWVQQVSFKPLLISIAIKPGRPSYDLIKNKNVFTINIVGDHERGYLKFFWKGYDPTNNPFQNVEYDNSDIGGVIIKNAKCAIDCQYVSHIAPGDHEIIIAQVLNSYEMNPDSKSHIHLRKTGLDY
jgi:flavin reductase (DIM6/NTAB) family NADH-FMN oxidoreductase RutF